ncbi:MAG: 6,7-dimethyl-8-ribityllumazine synthase [Fidelibacterota bacterium]
MTADLKGRSIALIVSRFYPDFAERLVEGSVRKYVELGGEPENLLICDVPGSFEIPQAAQKMVDCGRFDAVVCLGIVVRGETPHFDYVCENVTRGVGQVALNSGIPVIFGVLTTESRQQASDRLGGSKGHKGEQAMVAALEMMKALDQIRQLG